MELLNKIKSSSIVIAAFFLDSYAFTVEGIVGYALGKRNKKSFILALNNSELKNNILISHLTQVFYASLFCNH